MRDPEPCSSLVPMPCPYLSSLWCPYPSSKTLSSRCHRLIPNYTRAHLENKLILCHFLNLFHVPWASLPLAPFSMDAALSPVALSRRLLRGIFSWSSPLRVGLSVGKLCHTVIHYYFCPKADLSRFPCLPTISLAFLMKHEALKSSGTPFLFFSSPYQVNY